MVTLRSYQQESKDAILAEWEKGRKKTLLSLPTGCGKTIVFSSVAEEQVRRGDKVLILAHREELLKQAADKLEKATGLVSAIEKAEQTSIGTWNRVVVGSVQSLAQDKRLSMFKPDEFGTIIIDEAHHALSPTYQKVLEHFSEAKVLGVTATPDRGDRKDLGTLFESLAYDYSIVRAIREGYLSPIKAQTIPLDIDLSQVSIQNGDFASGEIATALDPYLEQIAEEMKKYCKGRKTLVFLPLIATSQKFTKMLQEKGFRAAEVNGQSKDREQILKDFEDGKYDVLCNALLLTEGYDCPSIDCIVMLRPTKIRSMFQQAVGRGTRLAEGKEYLLLLDFLWHTQRHDLCRPAHLIAKDEVYAQKMTERYAESEEAVDLLEMEEAVTESVLEERENALAAELRKQRMKKAKLVDPLQYEMSIAATDLVDYVPEFGWQMLPPSEKQIETLENLGIYGGDIPNSGYASMLIERVEKRKASGLSTPKQIRQLENRGFINVGQWSFQDAQKLIGRIAKCGWRVPPGVDPVEYSRKVLAKNG